MLPSLQAALLTDFCCSPASEGLHVAHGCATLAIFSSVCCHKQLPKDLTSAHEPSSRPASWSPELAFTAPFHPQLPLWQSQAAPRLSSLTTTARLASPLLPPPHWGQVMWGFCPGL